MVKVPNSRLLEAGLALMSEIGKPLVRTEAKGRAMIYRTPAGETVRVRTCNDHILVVVADSPEDGASLNIEGTDQLLIVMPEVPRTPGAVMAFLVPTNVAAAAVRSTHQQWLESKPNTNGRNQTWNIWFDEEGQSKANGFAAKWSQYRIRGHATVGERAPKLENSAPLGEIIAEAKRAIAKAAGVPESAVKITLDLT